LKEIQEIKSGQHHVILTSPEMCIKHPAFSKLNRTPEFTKNILALIVDEAHCISQWGDQFHKAFSELGKLRSCFPTWVPILVTSATLPPHVLDEVQAKLCLSSSRTFLVNLGNSRPNIMMIACRMRGAAKDLAALNFCIDEGHTRQALIQTIIFFNTQDLAFRGWDHLRQLLPPNLRCQINFLHAFRR
jgi:superfamily II DNA helicase RecQ